MTFDKSITIKSAFRSVHNMDYGMASFYYPMVNFNKFGTSGLE